MFQINITMATKNRTIGEFTLKTLFPKQFTYFKQKSILMIHTNENENLYLIYHC